MKICGGLVDSKILFFDFFFRDLFIYFILLAVTTFFKNSSFTVKRLNSSLATYSESPLNLPMARGPTSFPKVPRASKIDESRVRSQPP